MIFGKRVYAKEYLCFRCKLFSISLQKGESPGVQFASVGRREAKVLKLGLFSGIGLLGLGGALFFGKGQTSNPRTKKIVDGGNFGHLAT